MSRQPRDPRDPFDGFFNDRGSSWDPFNDPFFKQFEQMHEHIFRDFFGGGGPSIFIENPKELSGYDQGEDKPPDLSQINPNAPPSNPANNDKRQYSHHPRGPPSMFRMFRHFFEPEYDDHKLSDINPNVTDNGPIMSNDEDNKGLVHPDGAPPGFRSPYLPNSNGAEKNMEFSHNGGNNRFYRSQSVVISTGPDGKTTKTTTIHDSNGESTTTTEEYHADNDGMNQIQSMFNWNNDHSAIELFPSQKVPLFERTHDPLERFRSKWQNWKWNPYNWYHGDATQKRMDDDRGIKPANHEIKWKSYRDYKSDDSDHNKGPSLLDDIVKRD
eukprot:110478_1